MGNADEVSKRLAEIPSISTLTAQYVSTNTDGTVMVDFGQGPVQIYSAGFYTPLPGDYVRAIKIETLTLMLGPVTPRPAYGRVTATGSPKLSVLLPDGTTAAIAWVSSAYATPAVNDDVLINWASGGMIVGKVTQVPISGYLPPVSGGSGGSFSADFRASERNGSASYGSGRWFTDQVWCSDNNIGCWFYGSSIADTIPDGAAITGIQVYVTQVGGTGGDNPTIGLHALGAPVGTPTVSSAIAVAPGSGWMSLPNSFGDALKNGTSLGVGTNHGGYYIYSSRAVDPLSGLLRISWRT